MLISSIGGNGMRGAVGHTWYVQFICNCTNPMWHSLTTLVGPRRQASPCCAQSTSKPRRTDWHVPALATPNRSQPQQGEVGNITATQQQRGRPPRNHGHENKIGWYRIGLYGHPTPALCVSKADWCEPKHHHTGWIFLQWASQLWTRTFKSGTMRRSMHQIVSPV